MRKQPGILICAAGILLQPMPALAQFGYPVAPGPALWTSRIFQAVLVAAIGFAVGAFFSPKLKPFRQLALLVVVGVFVLFSLFGPYPAADIAGAIVKLVVFFIALGIGLKLGQAAAKAASGKRDNNRPVSFGSAKWATFDYLQERGLFGSGGFLLGRCFDGNRQSLLRYNGARHLLTVAPTRSGKGVSSIIPNLLLHEGSALVVDPKGENALITAPRRGGGDATRAIAGMGQDIFLLDPWNIAASKLGAKPSRFNPLDWVKADDLDATENAFLLADALVIKEGGGESAFWDEEAKALLSGIILYVATAPEEAGQRHLGRVRDILTLDEESLQEVLLRMFEHPLGMVSSTAARTAGKEAKLRSSVLASAQAHTHFLDSPRIRESLAATDFAFEDLKTKRQTVYLILPADRLIPFNRLLRLLIQQAITVNARNIAEQPTKPILFMLDEMPALGRLPSVEQAYSLMAGFGMQLWGIVQDLSQLARTYGQDGYQTFISNCGAIQYMGSRDRMTAEYFSSLCGVMTITLRNISWAIGQAVSFARGFSSGGGSSSTTTDGSTRTNTESYSEAQRQLAYPDELMRLGENVQIVFVENLDPIAAQKVVWYRDSGLKSLGVNLHVPLAQKPAATPLAHNKPQPAPGKLIGATHITVPYPKR